MKIGIVRFYRVVNYGAMLQAYSLMNTLERMGHEVVFIRYKFCSPKRLPVWRTLVSRNLKGLKSKLKELCLPLDYRFCRELSPDEVL